MKKQHANALLGIIGVAAGLGVLPPSAKLHTLHFMAWNRENGRLTRADIPFALVRLKEGPVDLMRFLKPAGYPMERVVSIRMSDIERAGPALLFDEPMPGDSQVVIWTD